MGATDAFVQCRVSNETKSRLRAFAAEQHLSESAVLKRFLYQALFTPAERVFSSVAEPHARRSARLYIRLSPSDRELLQARAEARAMPEATYAALLLRSTLRIQAPLPRAELAALLQSIAELSAVGRELRHLIRSIAKGIPTPGYTSDTARTMLTVCEALRHHTKSLLEANAASWGQGESDD